MSEHRELTGEDIVAAARALDSLCRTMCAKLPAHADDLMSATIERAWQCRRQFHGGSLTAWMYVIMRNRFCGALRRARCAPTVSTDVLADTSFEPVEYDDPETACDAATAIAALELLPDDRRVVLCLAIDGESQQGIANAVGIPIGTVKSRTFRAREAVAAVMGVAYA